MLNNYNLKSPINTNFKPSKASVNPTFTSWNRTVINSVTGELVHRNDTYFVRGVNQKDGKTYWIDLITFLSNKYKNQNNVNLYFYGCSDCSEVATFLMTLLSKFPKDIVEKFSNVKAIDIDPVAIEKAKKNLYTLNKYEISRLKDLLGDKVFEYFNNFPKFDVDKVDVSLSDIIFSKIKHRNANILHDMKNIKQNDSVVFARAFWPYLGYDISALSKKLGERLQNNSTLVLNEFDRRGCSWHNADIDKLLHENGFKDSSIDLVFDK